MSRVVGLLVASCGVLASCLHTPADEHLIQQLDREVLALQQRTALLSEKLAACDQSEQNNEVFRQLQQVYAGTEMQVVREGQDAVVVFPTALLFPPGSLELRAEASGTLDLLSTALKLHPETAIWIIGHTDDAPLPAALTKIYPSAWEWTAAQAAALARALQNRYGVEPKRFTVAGRGTTAPLADNDTPEGRQHNRRLEVRVGPSRP